MKTLLSFLILISLSWLGATWYIGRQIPPRLEQYFQNLHAHTLTHSGLTYRTKVLRQTFFNTTIRITAEASNSPYKKRFDALPPKDRSITLDIEHGPLFFHHGIGAGLARISATKPHKELQGIFDLFGLKFLAKQGKFRILYTLSFTKNAHLEIQTDAVTLTSKAGNSPTLWMATLSLDAQMHLETLAGTYQVKVPTLEIRQETYIPLSVKDLLIDYRALALPDAVPIMDHLSLQAAHARLSANPKKSTRKLKVAPRIVLGFHPETNGTIRIDYASDIRIIKGALSGAATLIRAGGLQIHFSGLSRHEVLPFLTRTRHILDQQIRLYFASPTHPDSLQKSLPILDVLHRIQAKIKEDIMHTLPRALIPTQSTLDISTRLATQQCPSNQLDARFRLIKALPQDANWSSPLHQTFGLISLDANTSFDTRFLNTFGPQGIRLNATLATALKQGLVSEHEGQYTSSVHYTPEELTVNQKPMSQFLFLLNMLKKGTSK